MLHLTSLLTLYGFDPNARTKLVRHQDAKWDVNLLWHQGHLEPYQAYQGRTVFSGADRLVSFIGRPGTGALFVGVYDVLGVTRTSKFKLPKDFPYPEMGTGWQFAYELKRDKAFSDLEGRLVVDWGKGTRSWVQHLRKQSKPVTELLPAGYVTEWPGFEEVVLRHDELVKVVSNPNAHREWHRMLASVAAIYLILDTKTGQQYVGSAYGDGGLLGRWRAYAKSVHGGNKQMKALAVDRPSLAQDLQFAVLQTLPLASTAKEVIDHERRHKAKLGSRAHGLNSN
jgi:hypothetical protein